MSFDCLHDSRRFLYEYFWALLPFENLCYTVPYFIRFAWMLLPSIVLCIYVCFSFREIIEWMERKLRSQDWSVCRLVGSGWGSPATIQTSPSVKCPEISLMDLDTVVTFRSISDIFITSHALNYTHCSYLYVLLFWFCFCQPWTQTWTFSRRDTFTGLSLILSFQSIPLRSVEVASLASVLQLCSAVCCEVGACLRGSAFCSYSLAWPGACCCFTTLLHSHDTKAALNFASRSWISASAMSKLSAQRTTSFQGPITPPWQDMVRLRCFTIRCRNLLYSVLQLWKHCAIVLMVPDVLRSLWYTWFIVILCLLIGLPNQTSWL